MFIKCIRNKTHLYSKVFGITIFGVIINLVGNHVNLICDGNPDNYLLLKSGINIFLVIIFCNYEHYSFLQ